MRSITLRILNGPRVGHRLFLKSLQRMQIGRTEYSDVAFPNDAMLSQTHFRVSLPRGGSCRIEDLGSTNGTYVNGNPVAYGRIGDGDIITAGATEFRVSCDE